MAVLLGIISFGPLMTLFFVNKLPIWYGMLFVRLPVRNSPFEI